MNTYAISPEKLTDADLPLIEALLAAGLDAYHLRTPTASLAELECLLRQAPKAVRRRIVLHQHYSLVEELGLGGYHAKDLDRDQARMPASSERQDGKTRSRSIHVIRQLDTEMDAWDYLFISPVFFSISKAGYGPAWSRAELSEALKQAGDGERARLCALGGVGLDQALEAKSMGFDAVVLHGALWESPDPVQAFKAIRKALL